MPRKTISPPQVIGATIMAAALALVAACQSSADREKRQSAEFAGREQQAIAILAARQDADSLAGAGLLTDVHDGNRAMALLSRATALAPDRADLLWLEAQVCAAVAQRGGTCDPAPMERRLRSLAPTNGAAWFGDLSRAVTAVDSKAQEVALDRIAHSERIDIYWTELVASLTPPVVATGKMSVVEAEISLIGVMSAQALHALQPISQACRGDSLKDPASLPRCKGIVKALQHGDTVLIEQLGNSLAARVWPKESPEWSLATRRHAVLDYRTQQWGRVTALHGWSDAWATQFLRLCSQYRSEQAVQEAQLLAAGKDPNPAAN